MQSNGNNEKIFYHGIKVLMYHKIVKDENLSRRHWTYVYSGHLYRQLNLLDKWGFTPITFNDFLLYKKGQTNLPKKPVIITFDDGYENIYEIAFPMLKEFGWNAVVFVLGDRFISNNNWDENTGMPLSALLNKREIIEMYNAGFEIGSHSMTHADLLSIALKQAWNEINSSKEVLQDLIADEIKSFCYPYGRTNKRIKEFVKAAGYKAACGVFTGPPRFWEDKYDIRRITISNTTNSFSFGLMMLAPYEYYNWLGSKARKEISGLSTANKSREEITSKEDKRNYFNV